MKRLNIDEQLGEPISIILDGKEYTVKTITTKLMDDVSAIGKDKENINAPIKQLAILLGVEESVFINSDIRKIGKALEFITKAVTDTFEAKNPSGAEAKQ